MLRRFSQIRGLIASTADNDIGVIRDLYFDGVEWQIRYVVVDTGMFFWNRQVLLAPSALRQMEFAASVARFDLNRHASIRHPAAQHHRVAGVKVRCIAAVLDAAAEDIANLDVRV